MLIPRVGSVTNKIITAVPDMASEMVREGWHGRERDREEVCEGRETARGCGCEGVGEREDAEEARKAQGRETDGTKETARVGEGRNGGDEPGGDMMAKTTGRERQGERGGNDERRETKDDEFEIARLRAARTRREKLDGTQKREKMMRKCDSYSKITTLFKYMQSMYYTASREEGMIPRGKRKVERGVVGAEGNETARAKQV